MWASFFKNPPEDAEHVQKCIESKNRCHFEKATFWDLQLCTLAPGWFEHFKCPKKAPCLWFGRFSSCVKRSMHVCQQHSTRELNCPNQRQSALLGHLKCSNYPGAKVQSCRSQKVCFTMCCLFFYDFYDLICKKGHQWNIIYFASLNLPHNIVQHI